MKKKNRKKHRVYFFDYLWWLGEKEHEKKPWSRMDGSSMFGTYYIVLIGVPLMCVLIEYSVIVNKYIAVGIVTIPILLWEFWLHHIVYTPERLRLVMKRFSSWKHNTFITFTVFLLPIMMLFIGAFVLMEHNKSKLPKEPIISPLSKEEIRYLRENNFIRKDTTHFHLP